MLPLSKISGVRIAYLFVEKALIAWFAPPPNNRKNPSYYVKTSGLKIIIEVELAGVGTALKKAREAAGISLTVAGDRAQMSGANFNRIENEDTKGVPLNTLVRAARAVGLDLSECLGEWVKSVPGINLNGGSD